MMINKVLRIAGLCSLIGGITTLILVILPTPVAESFDQRVLLHKNSVYLARLWIFFFHPQVNVIAALGITVFLLKKKPQFVLIGFLFFLIWGITECAQHAFLIDAVNQDWRAKYEVVTDEKMKTAIFGQLVGASAINGQYVFLTSLLLRHRIVTFGNGFVANRYAGNVCWFRINLLWCAELVAFANYYMGLTFLSKPVEFAFDRIYPVLQPISRLSLGIWLWKQSRKQI
jgi:hypothetical protein